MTYENFIMELPKRAAEVHADNVAAGWWSDKDGNPIDRNMGELLMLCVTEVAEAHHGVLFNLMDDHLPSRTMFEVELADVEIRLLDIAGYRRPKPGLGAILVSALNHLRSQQSGWSAVNHQSTGRALMNLVGALSNAMEGVRKPDKTVQGHPMADFHIAEALLLVRRIGQMYHLDIAGAVEEKRAYNRQRADHKPENRWAEGGKKC